MYVYFLINTLVLLAAFTSISIGQTQLVDEFKLECNEDKSCMLINNNNEVSQVKEKYMVCIDADCKEILILIDADNQMYTCNALNKQSGKCKPIYNLRSLLEKEALVNMLRSMVAAKESDESSEDSKNEKTRQLPFETLNYGKRQLPFESLNYGKRQLPFETLNYGKRSDGVPFDTMSYGKRQLPFESLNYGKRHLPFEALNYGRRKKAYSIPDGYIMGRK